MTDTLLLIDGHSVAYRAFFALPVENFATSSGQSTNAVYGFTSMLINLLRDENPTYVAVAFDKSSHTFRTDEYPLYKAQREASPEEFRGQVELIKEVLDAMQIVHVDLDEYEADDIIATLARQGELAGMKVLISTGDRDALQLVDDEVTVLYPRKGVSDLVRMTPDVVFERYGVPPARYPELAALVGETSDNLPGVPGVGPKTAAKWLTQFDGLGNLLDRNSEVTGKVGESFREHLEDVRRNRRLNRLVDDLALPVGIEELHRQEIDREAVHRVFDSLQFRTLRERLLEILGTPVKVEDAQTIDTGIQELDPGELEAWLAEINDQPVGVDFIGSWGAGTGTLESISIATAESAVFVGMTELDPRDALALREWLSERSPKAVHSLKGPLLALWAQGWELDGVSCDTELAAYILQPDARTYELSDLSIRHLSRELRSPDTGTVSTQDAFDFDLSISEAAKTESILRARTVLDLSVALTAELTLQKQILLLTEMELPLTFTLARMERAGIAVDEGGLEELRAGFEGRVMRAEQEAYGILGRSINLSSPKQLSGVLFDDLQMPKTKKTPSGGYTTDAEALNWLYLQTGHPFLKHLLEHRDAIRMRQTVDGLLKTVGEDGRIHTTFTQTIAATGRLSSLEPNLQNIPTRTAEGRQIREGFVVGAGYECLMTADYSQIEMRVMASASGDEHVINAFKSGVDFHTMTSSRVFGIAPEDITPEQRAKVKQMNFGLAYGLSAYGLSTRLGISVAEANRLVDDYFATFGGIRDYLDSIVEEARKTGFTETLFGRRRYLPDLNSTNRQRREMAERMALNAPIQGTAADIIKRAMLNLERALADEGMSSRILLQVHDELILEVGIGERDRLETIVRQEMGQAADLKVPLEVSVGFGQSWLEAAH